MHTNISKLRLFFFHLVLLEDVIEANIHLTGPTETNYLRNATVLHFVYYRNCTGTACT